MRFVNVTLGRGEQWAVNPRHVIAVMDPPGKGVYLLLSCKRTVRIKETALDVQEQLNQALEA